MRHDTDGYYFYNPQNLSSGAVTTWNGRIVGSDNGDADKNATQSTSADQPTSDGYKVTFADNTDHFDIASTTQAGWQVVGTSDGTFAYKVNNTAVTELNLFGNAGQSRRIGDLYGVILLPESATGREIEQARKLLIDRGAADGANSINFYSAWNHRLDMVEFKNVDMSSVTNVGYAWASSALTSFSTPLPSVTYAAYAFRHCSSLTSFSTDLPLVTNVSHAWNSCNSLSDFRTTDIKNCNNFTEAWRSTTALTSFPQDAKLGTEASNVNFTSAWRSSGLTSFSTPLPTAKNAYRAWRDCASLESFDAPLPLVNNASSAWQSSGLTSFSTPLPTATNASNAWNNCTSLTSFSVDLPSVTNAYKSWQGCSSLTSFSIELPLVNNVYSTWRDCTSLTSFNAELPLATNAGAAWWGCVSLTSFNTPLPSATSVNVAWHSCSSLTDFSADVFSNWNPSSINSGVFDGAWDGCTSLTSLSVEAILTSIDSSGKWATTDGTSGGTPLGDSGIDIDYDGSGLTAATAAAITSLKSKGWSIFINSVEQ